MDDPDIPTSEDVRRVSGNAPWSLANPRPLAQVDVDGLYRVLRVYSHRTGDKLDLMAKAMLSAANEGELNERANAKVTLGWLRRRLYYWLGTEGGNLREPKIAYLAERMLQAKAPELWQLIAKKARVALLGDAVSAFLSHPNPSYLSAWDPFGTDEIQGLDLDLASPAVYAAAPTFPHQDGETYLCTWPTKGAFLISQLLALRWQPDGQDHIILQTWIGYLVLDAPMPTLLLRDRMKYANACFNIRVDAPEGVDGYIASLIPADPFVAQAPRFHLCRTTLPEPWRARVLEIAAVGLEV